MSIEGAVADREALAETLADVLGRFVPLEDHLADRTVFTPPVSVGTYDRWRAVLDEHGGQG